MKVKNLTGFPFGTRITSRRQRRVEMTLILRACYVLAPGKPLALPQGPTLVAQGPMSADQYADDDAERAGECVYPGDLADWKPNAEVMLRGTCHTPSGKPLAECPVRFSVGKWSRTLQAIGRRVWSDDMRGAVMTRPVPFTTMPVDFAHAYGGTGYAANPVGMGVAGRELPNIEQPDKRIAARWDDPGPACFGPINPAWSPRAAKVGKDYGGRWKKHRAPYYAEDFDWTWFNAAPADQQLEGFLRGDEPVVFENLHPTAPRFETALPGHRTRAFVKDAAKRFREVPMNLDTLFVDLDAGKLYLTWRGLDAIKTDDMKDVLWALVASEPLGEAPLPEAHYRQRLESFEADPLEMKQRLPPELRDKLDEMKARQQAMDEGRPPSSHDAPPRDPVTAHVRSLIDQLPIALPGAAGLEAKLADALAAVVARTPASAEVKARMAQAANDAVRPRSPPILAVPLRPGGPPPASAARALRSALDRLEQARKLVADQELPPEVRERTEAAFAAQAEALQRDPLAQAILSRPPHRDPGPGEDLHGQDYEGRDLRGRDLRGANLKEANLTGANLAGANLAGTNLDGAVLCGADLTEADLTGADLTLANLTSVRAARVVLRDATLTRAFLQRADLTGAVVAGARGEFVFLPEADLSGADCRGMTLDRAFAKGARLAKADLSGASLVRCLMLELRAPGAKLARAVIRGTSFAKSDLVGADFTEAKGDGSVWLHAKLDDADFEHAVLPRARLMEVSARRTSFQRAILKDLRCYRASFDSADFSDCQLFGSEFTKCSLKRARFTRACLFGAKFRQSRGESCDFTGANLTRAVMQSA